MYNTISKHVPQRTIRSNSGLPWINKEDMKARKHLYDIAKRSNSEEDWSTYRRIKTQINNKPKKLITTIVAYYLMTPLVVARDSFGNILRLSVKMMLESPL